MSRLDDLRARIEALNRGPLAEPPPPVTSRVGQWRDQRAPTEGPLWLEALIPGREVHAYTGQPAYLIETPVDRVHPDWGDVTSAFEAEFADIEACLAARTRGRVVEGGLRPEGVVFLDIETTGLSPTGPVFLAGVMVCDAGGWVVRQLLAREEEEEPAVVALCTEALDGREALVSFNGIQFDLSYLRARARQHQVEFRAPSHHLDLLLEGRRTWGRSLPNCKLQTLESHVCGRTRSDDIPGYRIPAAYRAFLRTGDARAMATIVHHNALDLFTLADLLTRLAREHRHAPATATPAIRSRIRPGRR